MLDSKVCTYEATNVSISYPCEWEKTQNSVPNGVIKYTLKDIKNNRMLTISLVLANLFDNITDEDAKKLIILEGLDILTKGAGVLFPLRQ